MSLNQETIQVEIKNESSNELLGIIALPKEATLVDARKVIERDLLPEEKDNFFRFLVKKKYAWLKINQSQEEYQLVRKCLPTVMLRRGIYNGADQLELIQEEEEENLKKLFDGLDDCFEDNYLGKRKKATFKKKEYRQSAQEAMTFWKNLSSSVSPGRKTNLASPSQSRPESQGEYSSPKRRVPSPNHALENSTSAKQEHLISLKQDVLLNFSSNQEDSFLEGSSFVPLPGLNSLYDSFVELEKSIEEITEDIDNLQTNSKKLEVLPQPQSSHSKSSNHLANSNGAFNIDEVEAILTKLQEDGESETSPSSLLDKEMDSPKTNIETGFDQFKIENFEDMEPIFTSTFSDDSLGQNFDLEIPAILTRTRSNIVTSRTEYFPTSNNSNENLRSGNSFTSQRTKELQNLLSLRPSPSVVIERKILKQEDVEKEILQPSRTLNRIQSRKSTLKPSQFFDSALIASPELHSWRIEMSLDNTERNPVFQLERVEDYEYFFKTNFSGKNYVTFRGIHPLHGPVVVVALKVTSNEGIVTALLHDKTKTLRLFIETAFINRSLRSKDLLKILRINCPQLLKNVKLIINKSQNLTTDLEYFENAHVVKNLKVGVLYAKEGQVKEEDMYNNEKGSEAFNEFLSLLGTKVRLQGWNKFSGGLDVKLDSTGTHSIFTEFKGIEIMFHISTFLPFTQNDPQQIERKRHLGNDIIVILFKDGSTPFHPSVIKSQYNQIFIIVQPIGASYRIAVASTRDIPPFEPSLMHLPPFSKKSLREFLCTKILNAERAAMQIPVFSQKVQRTRDQLLNMMVEKEYKEDRKGAFGRKRDAKHSSIENQVVIPALSKERKGRLLGSLRKSRSSSKENLNELNTCNGSSPPSKT